MYTQSSTSTYIPTCIHIPLRVYTYVHVCIWMYTQYTDIQLDYVYTFGRVCKYMHCQLVPLILTSSLLPSPHTYTHNQLRLGVGGGGGGEFISSLSNFQQ